MAGLVPAIHELRAGDNCRWPIRATAWGSKNVDGRDKPGHDVETDDLMTRAAL